MSAAAGATWFAKGTGAKSRCETQAAEAKVQSISTTGTATGKEVSGSEGNACRGTCNKSENSATPKPVTTIPRRMELLSVASRSPSAEKNTQPKIAGSIPK